jgi:hypothetical protein
MTKCRRSYFCGSTILSTDGFNIGAYFVLNFKIKNERWLDPVFV